jgi:RNA polymerase-binding protein DksA
MGSGGWVSGGLRRAVSGVRAAMPGQAAAQDADDDVDGAPAPAASQDQVSPPAPSPQEEPAPPRAPAKKKAPAAKKAPAESKAPAAKKAPAESKAPVAKKAPAAPAPQAVPEVQDAPPPALSPWSDEELAGFRVALEADIIRLREELHMGEVDMAELIADSSDGAGDDQADAGSKTLEREQEMSVTANARDLLDQSTHALRRLEAGTYGICESCGTAIPAARLRAFPRATLCIACKQAEERR